MPGTIFLLARQIYKVQAYLGINPKVLVCKTVVLDTGAGSNFIRKDILSESIQEKLQPLHIRPEIRDASNRRVRVQGTVRLVLRLGTRSEVVTFNVVDGLGTEVTVGCDYLDKHVEAIRPRRRVVKLDDGTTIPIEGGQNVVRVPLRRSPKKEELSPPSRTSRHIRVTKEVTIKPNTQAWVEVVTSTSGLIVVEPIAKLYESHMCLAGNGISQVQADKPFKILVANFSDKERHLNIGQR